ncbi:unnamed protein product [Paramecium pentaurelia]|uniref:Uncharacterized protein n=1 Tax=Paramecium pentaurelia TaxID=43138 RepID=A0A8S1XXM3_9CILI|nr:unnamed protein product [Paramecium pentaurelia]
MIKQQTKQKKKKHATGLPVTNGTFKLKKSKIFVQNQNNKLVELRYNTVP